MDRIYSEWKEGMWKSVTPSQQFSHGRGEFYTEQCMHVNTYTIS